MKLDEFDAIELAAHILGMSNYTDESNVIDAIGERFEIDFETWQIITGALIKLTPVLVSPLTKTKYHAFIHDDIVLAKLKAYEQENK